MGEEDPVAHAVDETAWTPKSDDVDGTANDEQEEVQIDQVSA